MSATSYEANFLYILLLQTSRKEHICTTLVVVAVATKETNIDPAKMETNPDWLHLSLSSFVAVTINPQRTFELIEAAVPVLQRKVMDDWSSVPSHKVGDFRTSRKNQVHAEALLQSAAVFKDAG